MHQVAVTIDELPDAAADIDVRADGEWVAVCRAGNALIIASTAGQFIAPSDFRFPLIRWVGEGDILLIDTRTSAGRENAYVLTTSGVRKARFCVGDGVANAIAAGGRIVVTYFDEGVFGGVGPSEEGLCVFTQDGGFDFGYHSGVQSPVDIADCYCACVGDPDEVCFVPYAEFPLVRLNLSTREQRKKAGFPQRFPVAMLCVIRVRRRRPAPISRRSC